MNARVFSLMCLALAFATPLRAQDVFSIFSGNATLEDLVVTIVDPASGLTVVGQITPANNTQIAGSTDLSDPIAMAVFTHGETDGQGNPIAGTLLPPLNQNAAGNAAYQGGIGFDEGIVLSSGRCTDDPDIFNPTPPPGRGYGVEGPNNGQTTTGGLINPGEVSTGLAFYATTDPDQDLMEAIFPGWPEGYGQPETDSADATVLEFTVDMPTPGYIRLSFVFASDEYPFWWNPLDPQGFNDAIVVLIDGRNIATFRQTVEVEPGVFEIVDEPFKLNDLIACGDPFFKKNQIAPNPPELNGSPHTIAGLGEVYFNHEFGGFSKVLTRESRALTPGEHRIKIVVQDINDPVVDSALFVQAESVTLFPLAQGDYNGDGTVNAADYTVYRNNMGHPDPSFREGDGNGDGVVDSLDYQIWQASYGNVGNMDLTADFDRDGCVGAEDFSTILFYFAVAQCASRFEGDATGDGAVSSADFSQLLFQFGMGSCGGGGESAAMQQLQLAYAALIGDPGPVLKQLEATLGAKLEPIALDRDEIPADPDLDGDGDVDATDLAQLDAIILGK